MQKELKFIKNTYDEAKEKGLPTFNRCNHYEVDMSHLDPEGGEGVEADWMNTIVVKLPNGIAITFCIMQTSNEESCIDSAFHGKNIKDHMVFPMGKSDTLLYDSEKPTYNRNIYALIAHAKGIVNNNG